MNIPKWAFRTGIVVTTFLGAVLLWTGRQARAADEDDEKPELGVPHAECTMFGEQRERIGRTLLTPAGSFSALTEDVVAALPPVGSLPGRSRSGSLRETLSGTYIDNHIFTALKRQGIPPAPPATDAEFLRRVTLDLTGRIPLAQDVVMFLTDPRPSAVKRAEWIDTLLETPEWADKWAMFFGDLYRNTINTQHLNRYQEARDAYHYYILDSLRMNKRYDEMASELISGSGNTWEVGQANFTLTGRTTGGPVQDTYDTQGVNVASMFLGMAHMDCITCHDGAGHLDSLSLWGTQAKRPEALGLAAFFARTDLTIPAGNTARPWSVTDVTANRNYNLNTTTGNRPARRAINGVNFVAPRYPFGGGTPRGGEAWRQALARLVTADFQFARATVNRIWKELMVIGLVEPADQFDPARLDANNPPPAPWTLQPSHPQLLDALARRFIENQFDLKALMRDIANSQAYQLSSRYDGTWNPAWERSYARKLVRRLGAEEIHDAVVLSSGLMPGYVINGFREPRINFAMQLPDVVNLPGDGNARTFLDSFVRGNRDDVERRSELTILQALHLMNNAFVFNRTRNVTGTLLNRIINEPNDSLVELLYLHVLSRFPTDAERARALRELSAGNRASKAEDLMWSLFNKVDFIFNY